MRALVTGATGKVGRAIVGALLARGDHVRALVRDPERARTLLPTQVELVGGDVTRPRSLPGALAGCEVVFNAMGIHEQWLADDRLFDTVNAGGTGALVRAAGTAGVGRMVHTSSIDVFEAAPRADFDESRVATAPKPTAYERSKQRAEEIALTVAREAGVDVVIANPAAVYGGSDGAPSSLEESLIRPVVLGQRLKVPMLPPGGLGLVYAPGLALGQLLAAELGVPGKRYIFCDTHVDFRALAQEVVRLAGRGVVPRTMPVPVARVVAGSGEALSRLVRRPPLLSRGQLQFFMWNARPNSGRAINELGWAPTPLERGLRETLASLGLASNPARDGGA